MGGGWWMVGRGLGMPYRKGLGLAGRHVAMVHLFLYKENWLFWEGLWFTFLDVVQ